VFCEPAVELYVSEEILRPIVLTTFTCLCGILVCCSPVNSVTRHGIVATMVDAENKQPLERTETRIILNGVSYDRTSSCDGVVALRADRKLRLSWLGGPVAFNLLKISIEVEPRGYQRIRLNWTSHLPKQSSPNLSESNGIVNLGTIELKRR
jgi:hypothetical protein